MYKFRVCELPEILDLYGFDLQQSILQDILWQCIIDTELKASLDRAYQELNQLSNHIESYLK